MYHYIFYRSQRITLLIATRCSVYWGRVSMDWSSSVLTTSTMSMWPSRSYATSQGQIKQQRDTCTAHDKHIDKQGHRFRFKVQLETFPTSHLMPLTLIS